ncbi:Fimbrial Usher family protein [Vibrio tapetis subsp. tapetis]|uniref:Fimbrial Usher family protein n=2 Tax=Vibrio tapetis TaxID=52443 RepID=A0A2N8ZKG3_9VIBR|nr:Fimbrial Usher family protein [Vibrio tapetis subsp. tapetis]
MSLRRLCLWAIGFTSLVFFPTWPKAETMKLNQTGRDIEMISLLKISDSVIGEAQLTITKDDQILLPKSATIALLKRLISRETITKLAQSNATDILSQQDFRAVGLDLIFSFSTLECTILVPTDHLLTQQLSAAGSQLDSNYLEPSLVSGYVNVSLSGTQTQAVNKDSIIDRQTNHRFESAFSVGQANLEYESNYQHSSTEAASYSRNGTRVNVDFPTQGTRLVVGDMFNNGKNLQGSADILGIGITRDFTLIPTRNVRPKATQSFTLQRTSSVDVVIDGAIVQRLTLNAGSYNLNDIPLAQGNNDIELIITDATGKQERVQFSVATGNDLLDSGEFEYSLMFGAPSGFNGNQIKYETDQRLLHGYLDLGVYPWLTIGLNAQSQEDLYQYGSSLLMAGPFGVTEFIASKSHHPNMGDGHAMRIAFDASFADNHSLRPQWSVIYDYQTENFAGVDDYQVDDQILNNIAHYISMFGSVNLTPRLRAAASATYSSGISSNNNYWSLSPSLSGSFFDTPATWSTRVDYRDYQQQQDELSASLTLSWPLSQATRIVGRYVGQNDQAIMDINYKEGVGNTGALSAFATVTTDPKVNADVDAGVNYTGNRYQFVADHTTRYEDINQDNRTHNTRVQLSSAIAFAGTSVAIGRKVGESFAVIKKHKSLAENRVAIEPLRNTEYARVVSDSSSNVLLPDLVAYNAQLIGYDVENLPPGYDLGDGAFLLNPGYNRGYQLTVGSDAVLTVIGRMLDKKTGSPIQLIAGNAIFLDDDKQESVEFFTNRTGRFAISGLQPGSYRLELNMKKKRSLVITLDQDSDVLTLLGELYVD